MPADANMRGRGAGTTATPPPAAVRHDGDGPEAHPPVSNHWGRHARPAALGHAASATPQPTTGHGWSPLPLPGTAVEHTQAARTGRLITGNAI
jgi:hypothetical protein